MSYFGELLLVSLFFPILVSSLQPTKGREPEVRKSMNKVDEKE